MRMHYKLCPFLFHFIQIQLCIRFIQKADIYMHNIKKQTEEEFLNERDENKFSSRRKIFC